MSTEPGDLADRLLDAQVEFVLAELSSGRFAEVAASAVTDASAVAATVVVADVVDADQVKQAGRRLVELIGGSVFVEDMGPALADAIYALSYSEDHRLGEVVDRDPVAALVAKLLSMNTLHERALDRLTESPLVAVVASRLVAKLIADVVQQNRARAEKVPGVGSLWSLGTSAASRVRGASDRYLDPLLGDAAGKGAEFALRRTNNAIRELIRDAPLQEAAMQMWDLHAEQPISDLRAYLSQQDLRELVLIVSEIVASARNEDYTGDVLDACVDVFFERYGRHDIAAVMLELGIGRDDVVAGIRRFAPPVIEAIKDNGVLAAQIRKRLEPFFHSDTVTALLSPAQPNAGP